MMAIKRLCWEMACGALRLNWRLRSEVEIKVRNYSDWWTYNEVFVNGEYARPVAALLADGKTDYRVWDLGANTGFFSLAVADGLLQARERGSLRLLQVEPDLRNVGALQMRMETLRSHPELSLELDIRRALVGARTGTAELNLSKEGNMNFVSERRKIASWRRMRGGVELPYLDLSEFLPVEGSVDLVKCDIEGSEFALFEAYHDLMPRWKRLVVEFHSAFGEVAVAEKTLSQSGFSGREVLREGPDTISIHYWRQ